MNDNKDIHFHSKDIKKKDINFNVEEKKSKKFSNSVMNSKKFFYGLKRIIIGT